MNKELVIISPTYNESQILEEFITDWITKIRELNIHFEFRIYNDGSTDETTTVLSDLQKKYPELHVYTKPNSGHGATIFEAYKTSQDFYWIFQIDSDHELPVNIFEQLWKHRSEFDLLMGARQKRNAPFFRRVLTRIATITVGLLFGKGPSDINIPYRLIRKEKLFEFLPENHSSNFAPNVLMTAFAIKNKWRIKTLPVIHNARKKTDGSGFSFYMFKGACNSIWQLLKLSKKRKK